MNIPKWVRTPRPVERDILGNRRTNKYDFDTSLRTIRDDDE